MPEFNSKKEWFTEAKRLRATGLSAPEVANKLGTFSVDGKTYAIHNKGADGITSVDMEGRKARGNRRNAAIKEQDIKLLETLKKGGVDDVEALAILKKEKAGYKRIEHQASALNREFGKGAFNAGHETAALEGGGNYGRNARVEIGKSRIRPDGTKIRGNQSRGRIDEAPDFIKPVMGIPRSGRGGEDTALINLLERDTPGIMDLGLTPQDKQNIKRNPNSADDIIAARQARLSNPDLNISGGSAKFNPNGRQIGRSLSKFGKAVPLAGLAIGLGQAGHAAQQGDYASAAAHTAGALVGEVPIFGDVIVDSVAGTGLTDGTLQSNQNRVNKTLYQEPKNTAAPTGITAFDNVAQPLIKGLAGQPMGLKPNKGSVQYGF